MFTATYITLTRSLSSPVTKHCTKYRHVVNMYIYREKNDDSITKAEMEDCINTTLFGPKIDGSSKQTGILIVKQFDNRSKKIWNVENNRLFGPLKNRNYKNRKTKPKEKPTLVDSMNLVTESTKNVEHKVDIPQSKQKDEEKSLNQLLSFPLFSNSRTDISSYSLLLPEIPQTYDVKAVHASYTPSVSTILEKSRPPEAQILLDKWKERMIEELGEEGFNQYQQELFSKGSNFHRCIQKYLEGTPETDLDITEANKGHWSSLQSVFPSLGDVSAVECRVEHPTLQYMGYFDCVALYRDRLCVIDWKTSKKPKPTIRSTWDNPLQVAAYMGAFNCDTKYNTQVEDAAIVVAYEDGSPAHVHMLNRDKCVFYWGQWLDRLYTYYKGATQASQNTPET